MLEGSLEYGFGTLTKNNYLYLICSLALGIDIFLALSLVKGPPVWELKGGGIGWTNF
jgi:hypothetical protein